MFITTYMIQILTIGYGGRDIEKFISILKLHRIETVVDIRSRPYSRFQPNYNQKLLCEILHSESIGYAFMGLHLGGKPSNPDLLTNGEVDYDKVASSSGYQQEITKLIDMAAHEKVCIMCSELKPDACHRKTLVGNSLSKLGVIVHHINEHGLIVNHASENLELF